MERNSFDEIYEILDELNARIEEMVTGIDDQEALEFIIAHLHEKTQEFIEDLEHEVERLELIEM
ncbi:hypothetical protein ACFL1R_10945 [Candidatus Latescibacterota bacterium]